MPRAQHPRQTTQRATGGQQGVRLVVVGTTDTQTLTNKTAIGGTGGNDIAANKILGGMNKETVSRVYPSLPLHDAAQGVFGK